MAFTSGQKSVRILYFLRGLGSPRVARPLVAHGLTPEDLEEGWRLLKAACGSKLDAPRRGADPALVAELDAWENHWFPVALATLTRGYPQFAEALFLNLSQASGIEAVITVGTFVARLRKAESKGTKEEREAVKLLARRGLTEEVIAEAEALLAKVESLPELEEDEEDGTDRTEAEQAAWAWYLEWSTIARQAIIDRNALRELGFLRPVGRSDPNGDEEIDPLAPPELASPATSAPTVGTAAAVTAGSTAPAAATVSGPSTATSPTAP